MPRRPRNEAPEFEYELAFSRNVYKTSNYNQFKTENDFNRRVVDDHVTKLVRSIAKHDLTPLFPVVVDKEFRVFDGQHRLKALQTLQKPVHFVFKEEGFCHEELLHLNLAKKAWTVHDEIFVQSRMGNEHCIRLLTLSAALEFPDEVTIYMIAKNIWKGTPLRACTVKNMEFTAEDEEAFRVVYRKLQQLSCIPQWRTRRFVKAFVILMTIRRFDFSYFISQFIKYHHFLTCKPQFVATLEEMVKIYNHDTPRNMKIRFDYETVVKYQRA